MLQFLTAKNIVDKELIEAEPWEFSPSEERLTLMRAKKKEDRRKTLITPGTDWQIYTAVVGEIRNARINAIQNPPRALRGLVVDYDSVMDVNTVLTFVNQMPDRFQPQFLEITLSKKARLVWVFERELLVAGFEYCKTVIELFFQKFGLPTLLPGFDEASSKPAEVWTNGGVWYELKKTPVSFEVMRGVAVDMAKKTSLFDKTEIPLTIIAAEVEKKWPGRWLGEFALDKLGMRFWDETADCPTGCQVKGDGMLCFTGKVPFVSWSELLGRDWCEEQKTVNLGKAGEDIYFDGRQYWEKGGVDRWLPLTRQSIVLALKCRGMSDKAPKGSTTSEVDKVLRWIEQYSGGRVDGAAPMVNYRPGIVEVNGKRMLNTTSFKPLQPAMTIVGDPNIDFPFLWQFFNGHFARPELQPLDHFLGWLQRFYLSLLEYKPRMGQAIFLCGPPGNGKTLLCLRIIGGLCGDRMSTPINYFYGDTDFNDEIFEAPLIAINDEDSPKTEGAKTKFATKIKSFTVNPTHTYHPKFCARQIVNWVGRIFVTLNDDPYSVIVLPEVNGNTYGKMSFFASQEFKGTWPIDTDGTVSAELPKFARWLIDYYKVPQGIVSGDPRTGVKSFYDPVILDLSKQQVVAFNLIELLCVWVNIDATTSKNGVWSGTPTELMSQLTLCPPLATVMRDWTVIKMAKSLTTLARTIDTGVTFDEGRRTFKIDAAKLQKK